MTSAGEAQLLTRYLLDRDCPAELAERYGRAVGRRTLGFGPWALGSALSADPVAAFAFRHPWSIGFLDAAGAFSESGSVLRDKLLVMSAILETSPEFAAEFLPRATSRTHAVAAVAALGALAVIKAALGAPLLLAARLTGGRA